MQQEMLRNKIKYFREKLHNVKAFAQLGHQKKKKPCQSKENSNIYE